MNSELATKLHLLLELYQPVIKYRFHSATARSLTILEICTMSDNHMLTGLHPTGLTQVQLLLLTLVDNGSLAFTSGGMQVVADKWYQYVKRVTNDNDEYVKLRKNLERLSKTLEEASPDRNVMHMYQQLAGRIFLLTLNWEGCWSISYHYVVATLETFEQSYPKDLFQHVEEHLMILVNGLLIEAL